MKEKQQKNFATSRRNFLGQALTAAGTAIAAPTILEKVRAESGGIDLAEGEIPVTLQVNGISYDLAIEPRVTLLDALRENLGLTGSKKGCDFGQCGACTVLIDGDRAYSCLTLAVMQEGKSITTIEGLADEEELHPMQAAFIDNDGMQCGYCTSGQICASVALVEEVKRGSASAITPDLTQPPQLKSLSEGEIKERLSGNLCRCSAYNGIIASVQQVTGQKPPSPAGVVMVKERTEV